VVLVVGGCGGGSGSGGGSGNSSSKISIWRSYPPCLTITFRYKTWLCEMV
jgi:hypothetical protein